MHTPQENEIRQQLNRILQSPRFKDGGRSRRFLEFIVDETVAGKGSELKENVVGVHVFDRKADYDPRLDSIVRVEAGRLRAKLNDYYEQEGRTDEVTIVLAKGSYAPTFVRRAAETAQAVEAQRPSKAESSISFGKRGIVAMALLVLTMGLAAVAWLNIETTPRLRIAVLPFSNYSDDARDRVVAAQLTDKVTAEFVKLDKFSVVPSTSARQYDDHRPGVREIATTLQADVLLEARATVRDGSVNVEVRLSDGVKDRKFWVADQFVDDNIDELAKQIAAASSNAVLTRRK